MQFFKFKQLAQSWSVWVLSILAVFPVISDNWEAFSKLIPEQYHGTVISVLSVAGILARAVKQTNLSKEQ
ncbi:hypothetical protein HPC38_02280 [Pasteurellaceae bacterium HPA106]|uniref:DUF7940 domain-containing protein n=1 Tax=Spirabiliibacterium pneumoniae TaxID=221400 RepID=UPI001AACC33E|nr:hypothetical protein [Spirabiliibacterium pneumoniae]MBE2895706.1 hypothetical protein [Spirabiliibacterium pneumoniae]